MRECWSCRSGCRRARGHAGARYKPDAEILGGGAGGGEEASAESQRGARRAERLGRAQCDVRLRGRQKGRRRSRAARESVKSTVAEGVALLGGTNQSRDRGGGPIAVRRKDETACTRRAYVAELRGASTSEWEMGERSKGRTYLQRQGSTRTPREAEDTRQGRHITRCNRTRCATECAKHPSGGQQRIATDPRRSRCIQCEGTSLRTEEEPRHEQGVSRGVSALTSSHRSRV